MRTSPRGRCRAADLGGYPACSPTSPPSGGRRAALPGRSGRDRSPARRSGSRTSRDTGFGVRSVPAMLWLWYHRVPAGFAANVVALRAAARHHRRSFLHRAIGLRGQVETVPVHDVVDVGVVADIDADLAAFAKAQAPGRAPCRCTQRCRSLFRGRAPAAAARSAASGPARSCDLRIRRSAAVPSAIPTAPAPSTKPRRSSHDFEPG